MDDLNKVFADVKKEGDTDPFKDMVKETPTESQPENKSEEVEKKEEPKEGEEKKEEIPKSTPEEDNIPFHKHPRWIERENRIKELEEKDELTTRELNELKSFKDEVSKKFESDSPVPDWFKELYGDNPVAWNKYREYESKREEELEKKAAERLEKKQQEAQEETKRWTKWVDDEISKLQAEGKQFDRNELIKTILDYRPTDENNNFDFKAGYKIYEALKSKEVDPAKSIARKEIADTTTKTSGEKKEKNYLTSNDLRNKSWNQL